MPIQAYAKRQNNKSYSMTCKQCDKKLKNNIGSAECPVCSLKFKNNRSVVIHKNKSHPTLSAEQFHELLYPESANVDRVCQCGCGQIISTYNYHNGIRFKKNHHMRIDAYKNKLKLTSKTEQSLNKLSETMKEQYASGERKVWCEGLTKDSDERLLKSAESIKESVDDARRMELSETMKDAWLSGKITSHKNENHYNWHGGKAGLAEYCRHNGTLYKQWKYPILLRDDFKCVKCGNVNDLQVHHDNISFSDILDISIKQLDWREAKYDSVEQTDATVLDLKAKIADQVAQYHVDNNISGVTLCSECHKLETKQQKETSCKLQYTSLSGLTSLEKESIAHEVAEYYVNNGFPHRNIPQRDQVKILDRLFKYDFCKALIGDLLTATNIGNDFCMDYHKHSIFMSNKLAKLSVAELFNNRDKLFDVINKRLQGNHINHIDDVVMRNITSIFSPTKSVVNFRPISAASIYRRYLSKESHNKVWDMCAGFGGRLVGAHISNVVDEYYGNEPIKKTVDGLSNIHNFITNEYSTVSDKRLKIVDIECKPVEESKFKNIEDEFDMCFTSPPFFDLEHYSDEKTQSIVKYPTLDMWVDGFLTALIKNAYKALKHLGIIAINIKNIKGANKLEQITQDLLLSCGFVYVETIKYPTSNWVKKQTNINFEPIFVYRKQ
jgi:cytochrome c553